MDFSRRYLCIKGSDCSHKKTGSENRFKFFHVVKCETKLGQKYVSDHSE